MESAFPGNFSGVSFKTVHQDALELESLIFYILLFS